LFLIQIATITIATMSTMARCSTTSPKDPIIAGAHEPLSMMHGTIFMWANPSREWAMGKVIAPRDQPHTS
jgi:hypothetical protein